MIECTIYFEDGEYLANTWRVGEKAPFSQVYLSRAVRAEITAYGDGYDYIFDNFSNVPLPREFRVVGGSRALRGKHVFFYGDMALFILGNL